MRKFLCAGILTLILMLALMNIGTRAGDIDPGLENILSTTPPGQPVSVLIFLSDRVDLNQIDGDLAAADASRDRRHETVLRSLQEKAAATQGSLTAYLADLKVSGAAENYRAFWIANAVEASLNRKQIEAVAARPDVARVYYNYEIESIDPVEIVADATDIGAAVENGVAAVRAPEAWAAGYTGAGILVANIDTGVEGDHPALASRWAGVADPRYDGHPEWAWYDPYLGINDFPYDNHGHGTHTMGTICGGAPGDEVGVAPGALWMAAGAIDRGGGIARTVADAIASFQWMTDPDGNPSTTWDVPHVCSNSWGVTTSHGYPPCDSLFWEYIDACEAAGTVVIFAAGNEGTSGLRRPADRATDEYRNLAVAAVDGNTVGWPIAYFSSRGPTYCTPTGEAAIKPDISAPGVSVRSAYPGHAYVYMSGTSMATPHIAGVIALVRQANPNLTVDEVKQILYSTAYDLGTAGEDNAYGYGMVDAFAACSLAVGGVAGPTADFSGSPTSGCAPLTVNFTDLSTGENISSWSWNFGDGGTSDQQNPSHTYVDAGNYTVSLTVTDDNGSDTEIKVDYIQVYGTPIADFVGSPTSGDAPLTVGFTDLSTGNPDTWDWIFGDGGTSADQNPSYTYTTPGLYSVTLTVSNSCGSDQLTRTDYINVTQPTVYEMHVSNIIITRVQSSAAKKPKFYARAEVTIVDQQDQPLAGATVTGVFNNHPQSASGTTGANGVAIITSKDTPAPPSDWCFEVTNVTHATYTYDPASNDVTHMCESGAIYNVKMVGSNLLPERFGLEQNQPNPFNPKTTIAIALPHACHVTLSVFNITGQKVTSLVDGNLGAGYHTFEWDGTNFASGIYFYRMQAGIFVESKKMVLLK